MPVNPLTAAVLTSQGGGNEASLLGLVDPSALADAQLGQGLEQQGLSTAPASPMQAIARMAQAGAGRFLQQSAMSDLGKVYAGATDAMGKIFPPGTDIGDAIRSDNPLVKLMGFQQAGHAMLLRTAPETLEPGARRFSGKQFITENTNPQSDVGKKIRDANLAAAQGNPGGANAIASSVTRENTDQATGYNYPPTNVWNPNRGVAINDIVSSSGPTPAVAVPPPAPKPANAGAQNFNDRYNDRVTAPNAGQQLPGFAAASATKAGADAAMKDFVEKSTPAYNSAQALKGRLDIIDHNIDTLGPNWMGSGANAKAEFGKAWNSTLDTFGVQGMHVDPSKIASWEDFNKETTRAGMELIKSNFGGSREAASIIQMGTTAVPSVSNTYLGAKYVSATIRAAAQREIDLHEFKSGLAQNGQSMVGADVAFNKMPGKSPSDYAMGAITSQIPAPAKQMLQSDPKLVGHFDKQFGPGTGEYILRSTGALK